MSKINLWSHIIPKAGDDMAQICRENNFGIYGQQVIQYSDDTPDHMHNGSLSLNGTVLAFNMPNIAGPNVTNGSNRGFTIDLWIKPISYGGNSMIMSISGNGCRFWVNYNGENWGTWRCSINVVNAVGIPTGKWSRFTIASDSENSILRGFVDGKLQITITGGDWTKPVFYIGGNDPWNGGGYTTSHIAELYVAESALFTEEFDPLKGWLIESNVLYQHKNLMYAIRKEN